MNAFEDIYKQARDAEKKWEVIDKRVEYIKEALSKDNLIETDSFLRVMGEVIVLLAEVQRPTNVGTAVDDLQESLKGLQNIMGSFGKLK